jgi:hypothetical protein
MTAYELLLFEQESDTLDFKSRQYSFAKGTEEEKAEILKDILAFTNSWRRADAYVLTGVQEVKGDKSTVVGIDEDIDDAALQQFVNSKTRKPIRFSYRAVQLEGKKVGIFHIPVQERPRYLKSDFGYVKGQTVYLRRGTTTTIASPEEIAEMGKAFIQKEAPTLEFGFANIGDREKWGYPTKIERVVLKTGKVKDIQDFSDPREYGPLGHLAMLGRRSANAAYYRELVRYYYEHSRSVSFGFYIANSSSVLANDVLIEINIPKGGSFAVIDPDRLPDYPEKYNDRMPYIQPIAHQLRAASYQADVKYEQTKDAWLIRAMFDKVQPKQTLFTRDELGFAVTGSADLDCSVCIYADNLAEPIKSVLTVSLLANEQDGSLSLVEKMHEKHISEMAKTYQARSKEE